MEIKHFPVDYRKQYTLPKGKKLREHGNAKNLIDPDFFPLF